MFFEQIYDKTLAQGSYLIGCQATKEAIVIDAKRDIDTYLDIAKRNNLKITHITETHIHADYLCGSRELAAATGAAMYLSDEGGEGWLYEFPHIGVKDGSIIKVGNLTLEVMHTPGHTSESISFLLTDHPASDQPVMLFTGDFVFVGDVGRPDLLEKAAGIVGTKEAGAKDMYQSLKRFNELPDYVQVWPAHGAGSACGKALGAVPSSTVGYEKIRNWALQYENKESEFIDTLLAGQPEPPKYFAMMKYLNKTNRKLLVEVPKVAKLSKDQFLSAYNKGLKVIDTREKDQFAQGHIANTLSITGNNSFSTWMGWFINYQEQFVLIADENKIEDLTRKLMRIGLDNVYGYLPTSDLNDLGLNMEQMNLINIEAFKSYIGNEKAQIVDVRNLTEYTDGHVKGATHAFVGSLPEHLEKLSHEKELIVHCLSGARAAIAFSILKRNGFKNIKTYFGGMQEWYAKGNSVETKEEPLALK
ncbi:MAG TPA: MBL fold metallo-hydrolase [Edaphocola sp.]|nr:MBL fold metallo-hydrolase [Edaphocola sp.]